MKRDKVAKIARLISCKNFVSEREKFIFDAFVERFENGSDMSGFFVVIIINAEINVTL